MQAQFLSSAIKSRMTDPLGLATQAVVARRVSDGASLERQVGFDAGRRFGCCQPCHDIEDVFGAQAAALQYQLNGYQHGIESGDRYGSQDLRHDPVTAGMTPQTVLKLTQRRGRSVKGAPLRSAPGLRSISGVVLPVVADLVAIQQARMAGDQRIIGHHLDSGRIQTAADPLTRVLTAPSNGCARH